LQQIKKSSKYFELPKRRSNLGVDEDGLREVYARLGFNIVGESVYDKLYLAERGSSPDWEIGHLPNDPKERLFYKGRFRATVIGEAIKFEQRFYIRLALAGADGELFSSAEAQERYGGGTPEPQSCAIAQCVYDRLLGEIVFTSDFVRTDDSEERVRQLDVQKKSAETWLDENRPEWRNPLAYW